MIRIIGIEDINIELYYTSIDSENIPHWINGYCINDLDTKVISD